jgi:hypothetical protein
MPICLNIVVNLRREISRYINRVISCQILLVEEEQLLLTHSTCFYSLSLLLLKHLLIPSVFLLIEIINPAKGDIENKC